MHFSFVASGAGRRLVRGERKPAWIDLQSVGRSSVPGKLQLPELLVGQDGATAPDLLEGPRSKFDDRPFGERPLLTDSVMPPVFAKNVSTSRAVQ